MGRLTTEKQLPPDILARANLRGNEYAWQINDIPDVIKAARDAGLVNVGGQLQFRFPGATCECYWVQVDTYKIVSKTLPWKDRVESTAIAALTSFKQLGSVDSLIAEGRKSFPKQMTEFEASGQEAAKAMCFVWYVISPHDEATLP